MTHGIVLLWYVMILLLLLLLPLACTLSGPNRGHYITIVKSHGYWLLFDDDIVEASQLLVI